MSDTKLLDDSKPVDLGKLWRKIARGEFEDELINQRLDALDGKVDDVRRDIQDLRENLRLVLPTASGGVPTEMARMVQEMQDARDHVQAAVADMAATLRSHQEPLERAEKAARGGLAALLAAPLVTRSNGTVYSVGAGCMALIAAVLVLSLIAFGVNGLLSAYHENPEATSQAIHDVRDILDGRKKQELDDLDGKDAGHDHDEQEPTME